MKKRKAHSNMKRLTLVSRCCMKNLAIVWCAGEKSNFVHIKTKKLIPASQDLIVAAKSVQHPWRVYISVLSITSNGDRFAPIEECSPPRPCYQENMEESLNEAHLKMIAKTRLKDRVNIAWVAVPLGTELTEDQVVELIETLEPWDKYTGDQLKLESEKTLDDKLMEALL